MTDIEALLARAEKALETESPHAFVTRMSRIVPELVTALRKAESERALYSKLHQDAHNDFNAVSDERDELRAKLENIGNALVTSTRAYEALAAENAELTAKLQACCDHVFFYTQDGNGQCGDCGVSR